MRKMVLVTGATSGIGYELAKIFAQDQCDLVLVARGCVRLDEVKQELEQKYACSVISIVADLACPESPGNVFNKVKQAGRQVDVLINNAGSGLCGAYSQLSWEQESHMLQLNCVSLCALTKFFLPGMIDRKNGKILNVASVAGFAPGPFMAIYYATKAFVMSYSQAISSELKGTGVTVTALCPGPTRTGFQAVAYKNDHARSKEKRFAKASDVARFGYKAMQQGVPVAVYGIMNKLLVALLKFLPGGLSVHIIKAVQEKRISSNDNFCYLQDES